MSLGKFEKRLASAKTRHANAMEKVSNPWSPPRLIGAVTGGAVAGAINGTAGPGTTALVGGALGLVSLALSPKLRAGVGEAALSCLSAAVAKKSEEYAPLALAYVKSKATQLTASVAGPKVQLADPVVARMASIDLSDTPVNGGTHAAAPVESVKA